LKLYVPWKVVTNFLLVIFVAIKHDQAGALLLAWTMFIPFIKIITEIIIEFTRISIGFLD